MAPNSKLSLITLISILISFLTIVTSQSCEASGYLRGIPGTCHVEYDSNYCCKANKLYPQYHCSPHVTKATRAIMTVSNFNGACDGGCTPGCDGQYHADTELVVALSTGWYGGGRRCLNSIRINANGRSVVAKVVDECDSIHGCDVDTDFQPPCRNDDVDASPAVWKALGIASTDVGEYEITWSDV